jgi:hypothetical protein
MLLALDIATNTGACWGRGDELPALCSFRLPSTGEDVGRFLCAYEDQLRGLIGQVEPTRIIFEAPVLPRAKFNKTTKRVEGGVSLMTTRKLQGLAGVTEMVAHREGLDCREVQPAEAKQALTGKGNAKKPEMVRACRAFGLDPKTYFADGDLASDEADAFGVWLCIVRHAHPELAARWTPLFAGRAAA